MTVVTIGILAPLVSVVLILMLQRYAATLAVAGVTVAAGAAVASVIRVARGARFSAEVSGLPDNPLRIEVTPLSAALVVMVAITGLLVLVYAVGYLIEDPDQVRFYAAMTFFIAAMQLLVLSADWVLFLVAWELIALASYLLIGFWFDDLANARAGTRAFLTTRVTDLGLYIGIFLLVDQAGTTRITPTLALDGTLAIFAGGLLLLAAMGKAAQAPFQGWLEDAMAGPTPVSALLHSATLVAAGVILLVRAFPLFDSGVLVAVGVVGAITTVTSGLIALQEGDLKRVLAASTSSQLALMLVAIGAGSWAAAVVHLVANAAMKSSLFLGAGIFQRVRHSTSFEDLAGVGRDQRRAFAGFAVSGLALAGVPPLVGFWSKDAIVAASLSASAAWVLAPAAVAGATLTGGYIGRALNLLWRGDGVGVRQAGLGWMLASLGGLSGLTVVLGAGIQPFERYLDAHVPERTLAIVLSLLATLAGLAGGWLVAAPSRAGFLRPVAVARGALTGLHWPLVVTPALRVAASLDRVDRLLHRGVEVVGRTALRLSGIAHSVDDRDHAAVETVGRGALMAAIGTRLTDEGGIDRVIATMVVGIRELGGRARRLQVGLVSRELAYTAGGIALLAGILLWVSQDLF